MDEALSRLIKAIRDHKSADFYAKLWGSASEFESLPIVSRTDMAATPFPRRQYKDVTCMMKIVHMPNSPFLSAWSPADIAAEPHGINSSRPMSYFSDPGESLEKAIWCYEHNMVPLIGEQNPSAAVQAARICDVDSLITDIPSLRSLQPYLEDRATPLACVSIVGSDFSSGLDRSLARYAERVRLVLALPETGAFAETELENYPTFTILPNCIIEAGNGLVLTKIADLVTPIIRYKTGLTGLLGKHDGVRILALT